jgi:hypothetical protein
VVSQVPKVGPGAPGSHAAQGCAVKREILQSIPELSHGQLIVLSFAGRNLLNYGRRKLRIKRGMSCRLSEGGPMKIKGPFTPSDVAAWMLSEFNRNQVLFHDIAACRIREQFGTEFTCLTEDGNFSIEPRVLLAFRIMTKDTVVWERRKRYWRKRADYDEPGRSQDSVRRAMSQRAQDVSKFLTAHAGQYFCDRCISELSGVKPPNQLRRPAFSGTLYCHRAEAECVHCRQKRIATAFLSA